MTPEAKRRKNQKKKQKQKQKKAAQAAEAAGNVTTDVSITIDDKVTTVTDITGDSIINNETTQESEESIPIQEQQDQLPHENEIVEESSIETKDENVVDTTPLGQEVLPESETVKEVAQTGNIADELPVQEQGSEHDIPHGSVNNEPVPPTHHDDGEFISTENNDLNVQPSQSIHLEQESKVEPVHEESKVEPVQIRKDDIVFPHSTNNNINELTQPQQDEPIQIPEEVGSKSIEHQQDEPVQLQEEVETESNEPQQDEPVQLQEDMGSKWIEPQQDEPVQLQEDMGSKSIEPQQESRTQHVSPSQEDDIDFSQTKDDGITELIQPKQQNETMETVPPIQEDNIQFLQTGHEDINELMQTPQEASIDNTFDTQNEIHTEQDVDFLQHIQEQQKESHDSLPSTQQDTEILEQVQAQEHTDSIDFGEQDEHIDFENLQTQEDSVPIQEDAEQAIIDQEFLSQEVNVDNIQNIEDNGLIAQGTDEIPLDVNVDEDILSPVSPIKSETFIEEPVVEHVRSAEEDIPETTETTVNDHIPENSNVLPIPTDQTTHVETTKDEEKHDLFEHNSGDELMPWEQPQQQDEEVQNTEPVAVENTPHEPMQKFSFLQDDDDLLDDDDDELLDDDDEDENTNDKNENNNDDDNDDDDSFLESEDELVTQVPLKPMSTVSNDGIILDEVPRENTNRHASTVSKYAPSLVGTTTTNQEPNMHHDGKVGIVLPQQINSFSKSNTSIQPNNILNISPNQTQLPLKGTGQVGNAQQVIEKLTVEKKKSDAYDFPMDLIGDKIKPTHAKPVGIPTPRIPVTAQIPRKGSRQSSISTSKAPVSYPPPANYQSLDAATTRSVPVNPYAAVIAEENKANAAAPHQQQPASIGIVPPSLNLPSSPTFSHRNMSTASSTSMLPPPARNRKVSNASIGSIPSMAKPNLYAPQANMTAPPKKTSQASPYAPQVNMNTPPPVGNTQPSQYAPQVVQPPSFQQPPSSQQVSPSQFNFPPVNAAASNIPPAPMGQLNTNLNNIPNELTSPSSYSATPLKSNHARKKSSLYTPNNNENASRYAPTVHPQYQQSSESSGQAGMTPVNDTIPSLYSPAVHNNQDPPKTMGSNLYNPPNGMQGQQSLNQYTPQQPAQPMAYPRGNNASLQAPPPKMMYGNQHSVHSSYEASSVIDNNALLSRQFPLFQWNASNKIVYGIPVTVGGYGGNVGSAVNVINVVNYDSIIKPCGFFKSYPGPLTNKTKKKDIEKWLLSITPELNLNEDSTESLIWKMLQIKLSDDYTFRNISEALYDTQELRMYLSQPFNPNLPQPNAYRLDTIGQMRVLASLQIGDHDVALRDALAHKDYAMAVLIGSLVSKDKWATIVDTYLSESFSREASNKTCSNLLSIIFQAFVGNSKATIQKFYSDAVQGTWAINNWRIIVAALLINIVDENNMKKIPSMIIEFLLEFAIFLSHKNMHLASSILFMIVDVPLSNVPVLRDSDVAFDHVGNPSSIQSIVWSEIYEYYSTLINPKLSHYDVLLPQKVYHGICLQEQGLSSLSAKYADYVSSKLKQMNKRDPMVINMSTKVDELQSRLGDSNSGWLMKPKLSSVWGQLDKSFNKYIGGDEELVQPPTHKKIFDNYTPSTSNNSSLADLTQHQGFTPYRVNAERALHDNRENNVLFAGEPRYHREGVLPTTDSLYRATSYSALNEHSAQIGGPLPLKRTTSKNSALGLTKTMSSLETADAVNNYHPVAAPWTAHNLPNSPQRKPTKLTAPLGHHVPPIMARNPLVQEPLKADTHVTPLDKYTHGDNIETLNRHVDVKYMHQPVFSSEVHPHTVGMKPAVVLTESDIISPEVPSTHSVNPLGKISNEAHLPPKHPIIEQERMHPAPVAPDTISIEQKVKPVRPVEQRTESAAPIEQPVKPTTFTEQPVEPIVSHVQSTGPVAPATQSSELPTATITESKSIEHGIIETVPEAPEHVLTQSNFKPLSPIISESVLTKPTLVESQSQVMGDTLVDNEPVLPASTEKEDLEHVEAIPEEVPMEDTLTLSHPEETEEVKEYVNPSEQIIESPQYESQESSNNLDDIEEYTEPAVTNDEIESSIINDTSVIHHPPSEVNTIDANVERETIVSTINEPSILPPTVKRNPYAPVIQEQESVKKERSPYAPQIAPTDEVRQSKSMSPLHNVYKVNEVDTSSDLGLGITEANDMPVEASLPPPPMKTARAFNSSSPQPNLKKKTSRTTLYAPMADTFSTPTIAGNVGTPDISPAMYAFGGNASLPVDLSKGSENNYSQTGENSGLDSTASSEMENKITVGSVPPINVIKRDEKSHILENFEPIIKPSSSVSMNIPSVRTVEEVGVQYNDEVEEESDDEDEEVVAKPKKEKKKEKSENTKNKDADNGQGSGWFGWLKKDPNEKKAVKAKLGHQNNFYYDEKLKRWVNKDATEEDKKKLEEASAPPPPPIVKRKDNTVKTTPRPSFAHAKPPASAEASLPATVLPTNPFSGKPIMQSSTPGSVVPSSPSPNTTTSEIIPPLSGGAPVNLTGKKSNGLDDLINISGGSAGRRKKKAGRGYVNVMENR